MLLTLEEVEYIAELARLLLTDQEKQLFREQLSEILEYATQLQKLDTSDIPPTARVSVSKSTLREDIVRAGFTQQQLLQNAPDAQDGQFRVPPVFE